MRILLVEDEPEAARLLAKGLREQSYTIDVAGDGAAAVFRAETTNYDAIILDIMLPVLDGLGVCRALRQAGSSVPILIVTARGTVHARVEGLDSGADDYLTKPFDFIELLARLRLSDSTSDHGRQRPCQSPPRWPHVSLQAELFTRTGIVAVSAQGVRRGAGPISPVHAERRKRQRERASRHRAIDCRISKAKTVTRS